MAHTKAVILDFDDTLFMTWQVAFEMENEAAKRLGLPPESREVFLSTWGMAVADALPLRFPSASPVQFIRAHSQVIAEYASDGRLDQLTPPNIVALEQLVAAAEYQMFAVTSRDTGELQHLLDGRHTLTRYIKPEAIFHKDRNLFHKPDPRVFDLLLETNHLSPEVCLYVGDSAGDCRAAKGAGLQFLVCLESGLRARSDFDKLDPPPDGYIDTFAELPNWLRKRA